MVGGVGGRRANHELSDSGLRAMNELFMALNLKFKLKFNNNVEY
jgi:hypothetical protein